MENECDKHPDNFMGMDAEEFAWKFGGTSYNFQKNVYRILGEDVYPSQAEADRTRKPKRRVKLAGGLEMLAQAFRDGVANASNYVCGICKPYMK